MDWSGVTVAAAALLLDGVPDLHLGHPGQGAGAQPLLPLPALLPLATFTRMGCFLPKRARNYIY